VLLFAQDTMAPPVGGGGGGGGKRKPFRSISQVLDTPVTPELLAALPAPVQQTNLMMGPKMSQVGLRRSAVDVNQRCW